MKFLVLAFTLFPMLSWSADYWAAGTITKYHVQNDAILIELSTGDDPKCGGYNYYGDYSLTFPDPAVNAAKSMMAAHKAQVLFDRYKTKTPVTMYVSESAGYCEIQIISNY